VSVDLPSPESVRTVLLDAGGVLVRPDFERVATALRERGVDAEAATLRAAEAPAKREVDRPAGEGLATDEERGFVYFNLLLRRAGIARSDATDAALAELKAWHDRHCLWEEVPEGVEGALRRLRASGRRLAVVSNSNGTVRLLLERLGFLDLFEEVLDSAVEGVEKPDPRIFRLALERLGVAPGEALFVGDIYHVDVVGGRGAGLRVVMVDETGLYGDADCPRVRSLAELADHLVPPPGRGGDFLLDSDTAR
jgi:HAD superfamily hydrolase (TIGR01509 family)